MEVSTASKQVVSGVVIRLSVEETRQLLALLTPLPSSGIVYPPYHDLRRVLRRDLRRVLREVDE